MIIPFVGPYLRVQLSIQWLLVLLLLLHHEGSAQPKVDSLNHVLEKKLHDTSRVSTLNELAFFYRDRDLHKTKDYALRSFQLANQYLSKKEAAQKEIKKALYYHLGNSSYVLANYYNDLHQPDSAHHYFSISLRYWKAINKKKQQSFVYNGLGLMYEDLGKYAEATRFLEMSIQLKKQLGEKIGLARSLSNLSMVYSNMGNYAKALSLLHQAIAINKDQKNEAGLGDNYSNIGMIYIAQNKHKDALEMNFMAMAYINSSFPVDSIKIAKAYHDIGVSYKSLGEFQKSISCLSKSREIAKKLGLQFVAAVNDMSLGSVYAQKKDYKTATTHVLRALPYFNSSKHSSAIATAHVNLGVYYTQQGLYGPAETHFLQGKQIADSTGAKKILYEVYGSLADLYEKQKNPVAALSYLKLHQKLGDSLTNMESMKQVRELETRFKTELKDQRISFLTKQKKEEKEKFNARIREQAMWQKIFIIGFLVSLAFIAVIIFAYRQKIRSNALLAAKTKEINEQKASLKGQEEERKRIAQELHDGIGGSLAAIKLNLTHLSSKHDLSELGSVIDNLGETCKEVRNISHNLSPPAFDHSSFTKVLRTFIEKISVPGQLEIQLEFFPENELDALPVPLQTEVYRLIQETLNNVSRHAAASAVEVALSIEDNTLFVMVEDNGRGFDEKNIQPGIGITNMRSRVLALNGHLVIESKPARGTAVHFKLPIG